MSKLLGIGVGALALVVLFSLSAGGWGANAHRVINRTTVRHLPGQMMLFIQDSLLFETHSVDADNRRVSGDTSMFAEAPRHFIDIDDYPNFHNLPRTLDSVIVMYGWERAKNNGTVPWATIWNYDSLVAQLRRSDWTTAKLTASDLGHYVGDAHQPLHVTKNYDGQLSGNSGIHSRYESTMLSSTYYLSALYIVPDSVRYIADRINYVFDYLFHSNSVIDTIFHGDTYGKAASGGAYNSTYYAELWNHTRVMTLDQMQRGTKALASLWYSAWVDAGLIVVTGVPPATGAKLAEFHLAQNFPNPFNPITTISYALPVGGTVMLKVFSLDGREVGTLAQGNQSAGEHRMQFDASHLASGVYVCRLQLGGFAQSRKLVLVK
jgi:hypothetical protein